MSAAPLGPDAQGRVPIVSAIKAGDAASIESWLREGLDPNARVAEGLPTLVQIAIEAKNLALVTLFTRYGADLSATTPEKGGKNAYHYAALGTPEIMEFLLQQPAAAEGAAAICKENGKYISPLRIACREGDRAMAGLLLDYGIDVNEPDENGETPLHFLLGNRKSRETAMPMVRLLLDAGADIGAKAANFWDETPLFPAVRDQFSDAVRLLLDLGSDAAEKNHLGETLLHAASATYDATIVRMLIDGGAKLEEKNRVGRTALHIAAHANKLEVVKVLLAAGADPYATDKSGKTPDALCLGDFQKNVHREILRKQMEWDAKRMTLPRSDYYSRRRAALQPPLKNRSSRPWGNRR